MWGARVWSVREVEILRLLISESKVLGASVKSKTLGERTGPTAPHHLPALKGSLEFSSVRRYLSSNLAGRRRLK